MTASLMNPVDQRVTAESPISLEPQTSMPVLEHQSGATEAPVRLSCGSGLCVGNSL